MAQARGVLGLTPGGCWPFLYFHLITSKFLYADSTLIGFGVLIISCQSLACNRRASVLKNITSENSY